MSAKLPVSVFDHDALRHGGYLYTTNAPLSSQLANKRLSDIALTLVDFQAKRILDLGCGDGTYTKELFDRGKPSSILGIDPAKKTIHIAREKYNDGQRISFAIGSADQLPYATDSFDLVHIRGVLHHMSNPIATLKDALRVAHTVLIIEPNAYNPGIKLLELFSPYHIAHKEKFYAPATLRHWVQLVGGKLTADCYAGFVPFFCPDWFAKLSKSLEPTIERLPLLSRLACAAYVFVVERADRRC